MIFPMLDSVPTQRLYTEEFIGLDRRPRTNDGAFSDMENMSGDPRPLISSRKKRGLVAQLQSPGGMIANGGLAWVDGSTLYFNGQATPVNDLTSGEKQLVAMGAYIVIFPDGAYYNTKDATDYGRIDREWTLGDNDYANFAICAMDGTEYPSDAAHMVVSAEEPENPTDGLYWLNTGDEEHALYQWRQYTSSWIGVPTCYVKISAAGIGTGLKNQDSVTISGVRTMGHSDAMKQQLELLNNTHVIQAVGEDYIVVIGLIDQAVQQQGALRADRKAPKMDFVIESNNRLWGCRHGEQDGQTVNEIYASALGDFKNWRKYLGTSQDSYSVSVGTDGPFTGAITHRGQPYFFKEGCVHEIYGEKPSNYQMQTTLCDGVRAGCGDSLQAVNGVLYYLSLNGVQYFETLPQAAGEALGSERYTQGCAGEYNGRYYLSMQDSANNWGLYVLDTTRGTWHREDASHALAFARYQDELYMLTADGGIWALNGTQGTMEETVSWRADSGVMGYEYPDNKYLSRFDIRMKLGAGSHCDLKIEYDSSGVWESRGGMDGGSTVRSYTLPVVPKRCDHLRIRLQGSGDMQLYGVARILTMGADGQNRGTITR